MNNPFVDYYTNQAGSGLTSFQGYRYQRGHGFFGSLFQNILKPLGLYLGKQALSTGVNIGKDVLGGENLKNSLKKNAKQAVSTILKDGSERLQRGSGNRKCKSVKPKKKVKRKNKPVIKRKIKKKTTVRKKTPKSKVVNKFAHIF